MTTKLNVAQQLDCKGLNCPLPVLKTKKAVDAMEVGQILEMVSSDPGSIPDMAAWSRKTGHEIVESKEEDGVYWYYIRKVK